MTAGTRLASPRLSSARKISSYACSRYRREILVSRSLGFVSNCLRACFGGCSITTYEGCQQVGRNVLQAIYWPLIRSGVMIGRNGPPCKLRCLCSRCHKSPGKSCARFSLVSPSMSQDHIKREIKKCYLRTRVFPLL